MYEIMSLRLVWELGTTTGNDGLGGRTISNVEDSCEGRGWLRSVSGVVVVVVVVIVVVVIVVVVVVVKTWRVGPLKKGFPSKR